MGVEQNLFRVAKEQGFVTSIFDDYCPNYGLCPLYPFSTHKVCDKLLCNYRGDIVDLYYKNPNGVLGCRHGEWWIQQHLRYITKLWDLYPNRPIFHASKPFGCHSAYWKGGKKTSHLCGANDKPLARFFQRFLARNPETVIFLMSDHGYHYHKKEGGNEFIAGEYEHRNPLLSVVVPGRPYLSTKAANRYVSHVDVHKACLKLLRNETGHFLDETFPNRRSCAEAGVPDKWCNCFVVAKKRDPRVDSQVGLI